MNKNKQTKRNQEAKRIIKNTKRESNIIYNSL